MNPEEESLPLYCICKQRCFKNKATYFKTGV